MKTTYTKIPHYRRYAVSYQVVRTSPRLVDLERAYRAARRMVDGERVSFEAWLERFQKDCAAV